MLIRFAFLAAFPLACMAGAAFVLFQMPGLGGAPASPAVALLVLLLIAIAFTVANLRSAHRAEQTTNAALVALGRQALQVAGEQRLEADSVSEGGIQWLTSVFQSMVGSLQRERTQVQYRLSDLETLNTIAGTIIDVVDPAQFEQRMTASLVQVLRAVGGIFVAGEAPGHLAVVAAAGRNGESLVLLGQAQLAALPGKGTPLVRALVEAKITGRELSAGDLPEHAGAVLDELAIVRSLAFPVLERGRTVGAVELYFATNDLPDQRSLLEQRPLLETVARLISVGHEHCLTLRQLHDSNAALARANRLKSEFLASMSHELRTPMNSILGYSHVLLEGIDGPLAEEQQHDVQRVVHSAESLLAIIDDILDLSKIEAGRIELQWQQVSVRDIVHGVVGTIEPLAKAKHLTLTTSVEAGADVCWADPTRLGQMLLNLLSNAVKFTEAGTVTLLVQQETERVRFTVRDTGIGIAPSAHELIFEEFRQADSSTSRRYGGTGLGLAITRRLAQVHGGTIELHSEVGVGSSFSFTVPLRPVTGAPRVQSGGTLDTWRQQTDGTCVVTDR